ncbi:MAG: patatin-like phospholipase family protein [Minicystis sp.]
MRAAPTVREWLRERPYALALSSGFFGFFAHTGLMTVLEDEGLLPARLSGSSAGALVAGLWSSGVGAARIRDELHALRREHFWDPGPGLGLLRGRLFRERLESILAARTFAGCRAPLSISVYDVLSRTTRVLTEGDLAPAIQASCCVPFLFHPVWHGGRPLLDGGIADRPGILGLPRGERALHHHLASRSPWRAPGSDSMAVPARAGLVALVLGDLPRVGPFRLEQGPRAFAAARRAAQEALERRVDGEVVRVD